MGLVLALLFYCGSASAELAYLCFAFLRFWLRVRCVGSAAIWRSPKYIMPVIGSRNTHITEPLKNRLRITCIM